MTRDLPADFGDPLLNSWILAWDATTCRARSAVTSGRSQEYWNANIYYPHPLALAYSEHLTAQAVMILPIYALSRNPILCYNVVFLSTFVLSAIGMFLFVRDLTGSSGAAFLAGLAFGFAPYRFGTLPHVQVLSSMWMPFVLLGFHRFLESRRTAASRRRIRRMARAEPVVRLLPAVFQSGCRTLRRPRDHTPTAVVGWPRVGAGGGGGGSRRPRNGAVPHPLLAVATARLQPAFAG